MIAKPRLPCARQPTGVGTAPRGTTHPAAMDNLRTDSALRAVLPSREFGSVSCIVPCLNEAKNLAQLLPQWRDTIAACTCLSEVILEDNRRFTRCGKLPAVDAPLVGG